MDPIKTRSAGSTLKLASTIQRFVDSDKTHRALVEFQVRASAQVWHVTRGVRLGDLPRELHRTPLRDPDLGVLAIQTKHGQLWVVAAAGIPGGDYGVPVALHT